MEDEEEGQASKLHPFALFRSSSSCLLWLGGKVVMVGGAREHAKEDECDEIACKVVFPFISHEWQSYIYPVKVGTLNSTSSLPAEGNR